MITLSLNLDGKSGSAARSQEKKVRELIGTHFAFPGSDKLEVDVTIKENGSSAVTFNGPKDIIAEAKRLWQANVKPAATKFQSAASKVASKASRKVRKSVKSAKAKLPKRKVARPAKKAKSVAKKKKKK